ncbi:hypothetical protein C0J52_01644 [Blattella germanica]|nr:hypothetical protein C0J52_01644 [Blattella germanica]
MHASIMAQLFAHILQTLQIPLTFVTYFHLVATQTSQPILSIILRIDFRNREIKSYEIHELAFNPGIPVKTEYKLAYSFNITN